MILMTKLRFSCFLLFLCLCRSLSLRSRLKILLLFCGQYLLCVPVDLVLQLTCSCRKSRIRFERRVVIKFNLIDQFSTILLRNKL